VKTMSDIKLDVRVYPLDDPKGNTKAFASVAIDDLAAIRGVRVVDSEKGLFVTMPQSQDNTGIYHDIAFPLDGELRKEITAAVLDEFARTASLDPSMRGYEKAEMTGRSAEGVKIDVRVYPLDEPKKDTLAFASVSLDDTVAIRGVRIVNDEKKGNFVSMPQSKDNEGNHHDVAFPLSGDLRREISRAVLSEHKAMITEKKQNFGERLSEGAEKAARYNAEHAGAPRAVAAKSHAGALE